MTDFIVGKTWMFRTESAQAQAVCSISHKSDRVTSTLAEYAKKRKRNMKIDEV